MDLACDHLWDEPRVARWLGRLASFSRLILFDRRGVGLSDRVTGIGPLEEQIDDVLAVMDAAGSDRATLLAYQQGGAMALLFAATHPTRVSSLVLYSAFARATQADDYPFAWSEAQRDVMRSEYVKEWGVLAKARLRAASFAPSLADDDDFAAWWARLERCGVSPGAVHEIFALIGETDVREVLSTILVPTLVLHRTDDVVIDVRHARYLAERIPDARLVELPGTDNFPIAGDPEALVGEIEEFLTGARREPEPDRVLATVLFTDIVGSTQRAAELGDARWRQLLERHDAVVRAQLKRHRGREVKTVGDGFLATFDGPARGIRCAQAIENAVAELGVQVRAGLHTGECEALGGDVGGLVVHIGARVAERARAGEVLVSSTVKELVVGSGLEFEDRGEHELRGVPGSWRLFSVRADAAGS